MDALCASERWKSVMMTWFEQIREAETAIESLERGFLESNFSNKCIAS